MGQRSDDRDTTLESNYFSTLLEQRSHFCEGGLLSLSSEERTLEGQHSDLIIEKGGAVLNPSKGYIPMKTAFKKLYEYYSNKRLKKNMLRFYETKVLSKHFRLFRQLNKTLKLKHKGLNLIHKLIKNTLHKNLEIIVKATPIKVQMFSIRISKRKLFKILLDNIHKCKKTATEHYERKLKTRMLQRLKAICVAAQNLTSARMAAIRKVSQRRSLKNAYKGLSLLLLFRKNKARALSNILKVIAGLRKRSVLEQLKAHMLESISREYKIKKSIKVKRKILKMLHEIVSTNISKVEKHLKTKATKKVLSGLQYTSYSKKLKVLSSIITVRERRR